MVVVHEMNSSVLLFVCVCTYIIMQRWNSSSEGLRGGHETEATGNKDKSGESAHTQSHTDTHTLLAHYFQCQGGVPSNSPHLHQSNFPPYMH